MGRYLLEKYCISWSADEHCCGDLAIVCLRFVMSCCSVAATGRHISLHVVSLGFKPSQVIT
jgi:hypothetical protein